MHSNNNTRTPSLAAFYQARFHADPYNLLDHATGELAAIAERFGIDWDATRASVRLSSGKGGDSKLPAAHLKFLSGSKLKGRAAAWAEEHRVDLKDGDSLLVPFISFVARGGQDRDSWNGYDTLLELYKAEAGVQLDAEAERRRAERLAQKQREREARLAKIEAERAQEDAAKQQSVARDLALFATLAPVGTAVPTPGAGQVGTAVPTHPYAQRKQIAGALAAADIRHGHDKHGHYLALPLQDMHGALRGLQKIYAHTLAHKNSDKDFTWGFDKDGAHLVLGDLQAALDAGHPIRFVEGFATGGTIHLATGDVVVVTLDAGNLKKVFPLFCSFYPNAKKIIDADNDCWKAAEGKGNAGLLAALELAKEHPGTTITLPTFDDMDTDTQPTDWNDVHCLHPHGLKGVRRKLRSASSKLKPESKRFDYARQRLSLMHKDRAHNEALQAITAGMALVPFVHNTTDVVRMVRAALPAGYTPTLKQAGDLQRRADWLLQQKTRSAQSFRSFTTETLARPHVTYERVQPVLSPQGHPLLPPKVLRKVQALDGVIIVRAPMATGKTKELLAPLMRASDCGAYLAHRVSLIADACNRLAARDASGRLQTRVDNYQDVAAPMVPMIQRMGCCINSITHPKFTPFFARVEDLLIDEASQTLRHIVDGTVDNPVLVLEQLAEMMRSADRTVMCDADAGDALVDFAEKACPGEPVHIIEMAADCSAIEVLHTTDLMAHQQIFDAVRRRETVLVADDSATDGKALTRRLRTECPGTRVLHVHKDSKGEADVEAFLADPNGQCGQWDVVIYSPAISSGVSIETPHFAHHVGIFFGSVAPSDAVQMLRRDRTARRFVVGFHITEYRRETDRERIFRGRVAADRRALLDASGRDPEWSEDDAAYIARFSKTTFDDVWLTATAAERRARADFANNMLLILQADGYRVGRMAANPLDEEQAREGKKVAKAAVTVERHELIHSVPTPGIEEAQQLMRRDVMSQEENAQLTRYQIATELCAPLVEQQDIEFWEDRGRKRLAGFEALRADLSACQAFDNHLADKGVTTTRRLLKTATHRVLRQVFDGLGIDVDSGRGEFSARQARDTMAAVLSSESAIEEYNELPVGPYVHPKAKPKCATTWVKAILERLGLKTESAQRGRAKTRVKFIDPESWAQINDYYQRRQAAGLSSLAIHDDEQPAAATSDAAPGAGGVSEPSPEGGTGSQVVFKELETKVFHPESPEYLALQEKYPNATAMVERVCASSAVVFREEAFGWLTEGHWQDLEAGQVAAPDRPQAGTPEDTAHMSEWTLRWLLEHLAGRQQAGGAA